MLSVIICQIICKVLENHQHEGWEMVFESFFTYLCESNSDVTFGKCVADAVTDMVCECLPDDIELNKSDIDLLYSLYADYADEFEEGVRGEILRLIYKKGFGFMG